MFVLFGLLGAVARYFQGNGHAGPGRWGVVVLSVCAAYYSLAYMQPDADAAVRALAVWAGLLGGLNIAAGYTRWEDVPYGLLRYGLPPLVGVLPHMFVTEDGTVLLYGFVGPFVAVNQYVLAQNKPGWLHRLVGNRDVATVPAGFAVVAGLAAL